MALRCLLAALLLMLGSVGAARAQRDEVQVKAAYVLNFLRFTEWPGHAAPPAEGGGHVLVVVGTREFADMVRGIAREAENLGQRPVKVRRLAPDAAPARIEAALRQAHAVYVQSDALPDALPVLRHSQGQALLTIGDAPGFAGAGGMLGLVPEGARIVFDANPRAIHGSGLQVSAKVLKLARIVDPAP